MDFYLRNLVTLNEMCLWQGKHANMKFKRRMSSRKYAQLIFLKKNPDKGVSMK
jgi:hypothetical protein